jgi:hypothetical protein
MTPGMISVIKEPVWLFVDMMGNMKALANVDMTQLREALEASWDIKTAYLETSEKDNPALGQCYPTSRVVQRFFPETEIAEGEVWTGKAIEKHFWNVLKLNGKEYHIDFTWQQFPAGSSVRSYKIRNRDALCDGAQTIKRVELLEKRAREFLAGKKLAD